MKSAMFLGFLSEMGNGRSDSGVLSPGAMVACYPMVRQMACELSMGGVGMLGGWRRVGAKGVAGVRSGEAVR